MRNLIQMRISLQKLLLLWALLPRQVDITVADIMPEILESLLQVRVLLPLEHDLALQLEVFLEQQVHPSKCYRYFLRQGLFLFFFRFWVVVDFVQIHVQIELIRKLFDQGGFALVLTRKRSLAVCES